MTYLRRHLPQRALRNIERAARQRLRSEFIVHGLSKVDAAALAASTNVLRKARKP